MSKTLTVKLPKKTLTIPTPTKKEVPKTRGKKYLV
mgnify:FL=1